MDNKGELSGPRLDMDEDIDEGLNSVNSLSEIDIALSLCYLEDSLTREVAGSRRPEQRNGGASRFIQMAEGN